MTYQSFIEIIYNSSYEDWIDREKYQVLKDNLNIVIQKTVKEDTRLEEDWLKEITFHEDAKVIKIELKYNNIIIESFSFATIDSFRCIFPLPNSKKELDYDDLLLAKRINNTETFQTYLDSYNFRYNKNY